MAGVSAPTARRCLQGAALFIIGLGMLASGVAFKETMIGSFHTSVFGFVVMFGGVRYAITGPRLSGRMHRGTGAGASRQRQNCWGRGSFTSQRRTKNELRLSLALSRR